ncbi:MAG: FIST signal transduction protein [Anaerolineales bacterium]|jgi:hypothetical protein
MISVGLGYTTLPDPRAAASQLTDQVQLGEGVKSSMAILLSTVDYDLETLVSEVQDCLGDTPLWGGTSSSGVFTNSGWVTGEKGAAALMVLSGIPAGVGGATVGDDPAAAAQAAVSQALAQLGEKPVAFLTMPAAGQEDALLEAIRQQAPHTPVVGGASGESGPAGSMRQFANGKVLEGGYSLAAIGGKEAGFAFLNGYQPTGKKAVVTAATGRRLLTLDNRPAMDVYQEWTGLSKEQISGGNILVSSTRLPLVLLLEGQEISCHPVSGNEDGSIDTAVTQPVGATIELRENTLDGMIADVAEVVKTAAEQVSQPSAVFLSHCAGRALALGDRIGEVTGQVESAVGPVPLIGFLAFGEQGTVLLDQPMHANLSLGALVFGQN